MSGPELITDADVIAGRVASPIVLGPGVLLTPAARDRAVARGLVIVEADGSVLGGGAGARLVRHRQAPAGRQATATAPAAGPSPGTGCGCGAPAGRCGCRTAGAPATCGCGRAVASEGAPSCGCGRAVAREGAPSCGCGRAAADDAGAGASCGCGRTAGGAGDPALSALPDGVYLVRVRDGAAADVRPVAGAGAADPSVARGRPDA